MLQAVEDYLERATSSRSRVTARLAYSAEKEKRNRSDFFEEDSNLEHEPYTPTRLDRSGQFKQRSVFMENQLDLNESEMEYYEHIVNDLADKLEKLQEEKDDLQAITHSLGDRLQRMSQLKEEAQAEAQREMEAVRAQFQSLLDTVHGEAASANQAYERERQKSAELALSLADCEARISQLQLADEKHKLYVGDLENSLQLESRSVQSLQRSVQELQSRLLASAANEQMQMSKISSSSKLLRNGAADDSRNSEADEVVAELRRQIEDLQVELEDNKEEFDHLTAIIEDLREKEGATSPSGAGGESVGRLQAEVRRLSELVEDLRADHRGVQTSLAEAQDRNRRLQVQIDNHNQERLLFGGSLSSPNASQSHITPAGKNSSSVATSSFHMTKDTSSLRFEEIDSQHRVVFTPVRSSATKALNQSHNARSLLKVYMDNQLDLNESEMQYYEEVVNGLVEQVETLTEQKATLETQLRDSEARIEQAEESIGDLQAQIAEKCKEVQECRSQLSGLTLRLQERDAMLANLTTQLEDTTHHSSAKSNAAQIELTNNFLGISSWGESDSEEDRGAAAGVAQDNDAASKANNASWASFASAADESFFHRGDIDELKRQLTHREQQVRAQISQLQALQDSLSEARATNDALKQQKAGFKKAVEDAKSQTEQLAQKELLAWSQVQDLEKKMQREVDLSAEYRRSSEEADNRAVNLQRTVSELQQKVSEYRLLLETKQDGSTNKESWETPGRLRTLMDESAMSINSSSAMTPLKQRLNRTEAQVDELTTQLRLAHKAREELQLELEKVQIRCQTKVRQAEELGAEIQSLREEVDSRLEELDRFKLQEMKNDAAARLRQIDSESEAEQLRERIAALESSDADLRQALAMKESDLQVERDTIDSLRSMLHKMGEKDETTEDFISELRAEQHKLAARLSATQDELQRKNVQLSETEDRCAELRQELLESVEVAHRKERDYEQRRESLEREAVAIKEDMQSFHDDSESHLTVLRHQLEALAREKSDLEAAAAAQKSVTVQLERDLSLKSSEVVQFQRAVDDVAEIVTYYQTRLLKLEESLTNQVNHKLASFGRRLQTAATSIDAVLASERVSNPESAVSQEMIAGALRESQSALQRALAQQEEDDAEKESLWARYQETRSQLNAVNAELDEARQLLNERENLSRSLELELESVVSPDEHARLSERLAEAEQRALQMSTENANAFARSAKNIAFLEGECSRLQTLVDHFRDVNAKLSEDLNSAHAEGMQSRSLEHRVKLLTQDESQLKERLVSLEGVLAKKDRELLEAMRVSREQDERRSVKFEAELDRMNDLLRQAQDKMAALKKANEDLRVEALENETALRAELAVTTEGLRRAERESAAYLSRCEDSEFELRRLTSTLSEKDHQTSQAEVKVLMLMQEVDATRETQHTLVQDLTAEVAEKQNRIRVLEGGVSSLKSRLVDLEAQAMQREEEQAVKLLKYASCEKENRELRLTCETLNDELGALNIRCEEQQYRCNELQRDHDALREQHSTLKNETLRKTVHRLEAAEEALSFLVNFSRETEQHSTAAKDLASHRDMLETSRAALQRTESALHALQADFIKLQTDEQVTRATNESLSEENDYLRRQTEELVSKVTSLTREASALRSDLSMRSEEVEELSQQVGDLETRLRNTKARLAELDESESRLAVEMRSFVETTNNTVTSSHHFSSSSSSNSSSATAFNIGKDLFASPPLVVGRGSLSTFTSEIEVRDGASDKDTLLQVRQVFSDMRSKFEALVSSYNAVHESQERLRHEKEEIKRVAEKAQDRLALVKADRDGLAAKVQLLEGEVGEVRRQKADVELERDALAANLESTSQRTSAILRDLDSTLLEALAKANDAAAGIVPIDTDALPNLSISQSIIRHDDAKAFRKSEVTSAVAVLSSSVSEVDRATAYLVAVIHSLVGEHRTRKAAVEKAEAHLEHKERSWAKERAAMAERCDNLQREAETVHHKHSHSLVEVESCRLELERIKHHLADATRNNAELESEFKASLDSNTELRATLAEAETLCLELRSRVKVLQTELVEKLDEIAGMSEQLDAARKRATDSELQHEKTSAMLGRVRAEKDALDNVRRCLDAELERSRAEVTALRDHSKQFDESNSAFFEAEKLLAGLGSSLDQILPVAEPALRVTFNAAGSPVKDTSLAVRASDSFTFASPSLHMPVALRAAATAEISLPLSERVDIALKRLSLLNAVKRDEARSRRTLEGKLDTLTQDAAAAQRASEESHQQLRRALATSAERDAELKEKMREISALQLDAQRQKEESARLKREVENLAESLDNERKAHQKYILDLQSKDSDAFKLHHELENRGLVISKLQEQVNSTKQQLLESQQECDRRAEQLRSAKGNMDRVMATVEQLERGAETDKRERHSMELKLLESENTNATVSRLKTRVHELEQQVARSAEEIRSLNHVKVLEEESQLRSSQEVESYRKKVLALEGRIEAILQEKNSFADEIEETRRKIAIAKEHAEQERVQRLRSEAAVEALRRAGEDKRFHLEDFVAHSEEIQSREAQAEEEKRSLRQKLNQLREISDEKESQYLAEAQGRAKLEGDIKQLKSVLAKRNLELNTSSNYSAMLRTEGRNARKQILEAVGQIREIVNIVRIDAQSAGLDIASPEPKSKGKARSSHGGEFDEESLTLGLAEALGISDLVTALEALRGAVAFVRSAPKNRHELETVVRKLTQENDALRLELADSKTKRHDLATQCKHQIHTMQLELTEMRRTDSKNPHLTHQISELESSLRHERERKERALAEVEALKSRLEQLSHEAATQRHSHSNNGSYRTEIESLRAEMDKEFARLAKELEAVNHHRAVLRDTVDQLDKQVRQRAEEAAEWQIRAESHSIGNSNGATDEDALRRQIARYKARSLAATELANTYRVSVLALYADGASYGAAQFGWQAHGLPQEFSSKSVHLIGVGWIEREISTVRHSFEDEIRVLDSEVSELRAKLRQSHSYNAELRKRFEENIKSVYLSGEGKKDGSSLQQFEQLKVALDRAEAEVASLQTDLTHEKSRGRKRHLQLVEDLTKTLQARDAALSALRRLEKVCVERGVDIRGLAIYETLKSELVSTSEAVEKWRFEESAGSNSEQHRALNTMMRGLVETDHELAETERRAARRHRDGSSGHHQMRSTSSGALRDLHHHHESTTSYSSHHSSSTSGHSSRQSPSRQQQQQRDGGFTAGERLTDRLTESFLTNKSSTSTAAAGSGLHHTHQSAAEGVSFNRSSSSGIPVARSSSASRSSRDHHPSSISTSSAPVAAAHLSVASYQLQTVGHNPAGGGSSLRVTKVSSVSSSSANTSFASSHRAGGGGHTNSNV